MSMHRRTFIAAGVGLAHSLLTGCSPDPIATSTIPFQVTLNLAGAEFGTNQPTFSNQNPGELHQDYTFNSRDTIRYFCSRGVRAFRIPISWERLQPVLGGELDQGYISNLMILLSWIRDASARAIIDLHNYGRYRLMHRGIVREVRLGERVDGEELLSVEDLSNVWIRLFKRLRGHRAVATLGLMNEPHDMGDLNWNTASNRIVQDLRQAGYLGWISVSGSAWATAKNFPLVNGMKAWIDDPLKKTLYEAHAYFDADFSGKYKLSFEKELARDARLSDRPRRVLEPFLSWCKRNQVPGYIGEIGVPSNNLKWLPLLASATKMAKEANVALGYWAAGEWWHDYPLSVQPSSYKDPLRPQLATVLGTPNRSGRPATS